jgi:hypothetical protein
MTTRLDGLFFKRRVAARGSATLPAAKAALRKATFGSPLEASIRGGLCLEDFGSSFSLSCVGFLSQGRIAVRFNGSVRGTAEGVEIAGNITCHRACDANLYVCFAVLLFIVGAGGLVAVIASDKPLLSRAAVSMIPLGVAFVLLWLASQARMETRERVFQIVRLLRRAARAAQPGVAADRRPVAAHSKMT